MSGQFPQEFPQQAIQAVMKPIFGSGKFDGQAALGAYDVLGYALFQVFGDVRYLMNNGESRSDVANVMAQAPPEVQNFMQYANQNQQLMQGGNVPPWLIPFAKQLVEWAMARLFDRLSQTENPTLFGVQLKGSQLPRQTGGAFPERKLGVPSGTGLFTMPTPGSVSQASGAQSQPSDRIQQPTGVNPEAHPTNPQSSKSPQYQGNTADPERTDHEVDQPLRKQQLAGSPSSQGGPGGLSGPVTNAPGQAGTPGTSANPNPVPGPSPQAGQNNPEQGKQNLSPPLNSNTNPGTQSNQGNQSGGTGKS